MSKGIKIGKKSFIGNISIPRIFDCQGVAKLDCTRKDILS